VISDTKFGKIVYNVSMAKRIAIEPHLTLEEMAAREREATCVKERAHWQVIRLIGQGRASREVAEITGFSPGWVCAVVRRYNTDGPTALGDRRRHNSGQAQRLLTADQESALREKVASGLAANVVWTGADVAREISTLVGREVHRARGWELLNRWGFRQRVPRPRHAQADAAKQELFKKNAP